VERLSGTRIASVLILAVVAAALAWVVSPAALPGVTRIVVLAGAVMSLNLLIGNLGLISMGHGLFIGAGAYIVAVANVKYGVPVGQGALLAIGGAVLLAIVTGFMVLRARALFFALLTLAFSQVAFVFVARDYSLTGGDDGLVGIDIPAWLDGDVQKHLLAVATTTLVCLLILIMLASPFGATLRAIRDNRDRVASLGANPTFHEFVGYIIASALGAMVGVTAAVTREAVEPGVFSWVTGATLLVMVALGGRSAFFGPIVGLAILELTRSWVQSFSEHGDLAIGALVILCALLFPEGVAPWANDVFAAHRARKREAG